jgi:oligoendopeptidase F
MRKKIYLILAVFVLTVGVFASDGPYENLPPIQPDANMSRSEIPAIYKWNLTDLCPSDQQWSEEIAQCQKDLDTLKDLHPGLNTPKGLAQYMKAYFKLDDKINRLTLYANMQKDVASTNQDVIAHHSLALNLTEKVMQEGGVLREAVLGFSEKEMKKALEKEPALKEYLPYIQSLRRRESRVLSPGEEKLLSMAGDNLWAQIDLNELPSAVEKAFLALISDMTLPSIIGADGKKVQLTFANYGPLRRSPDRNVRRQTVAAMFGTLKSLENTFATTLGEQAKFSWFLSRARGYHSVLEAYLDKDDIDPAVYMNLINTVRAHVEPLHKYIDLRKKVLGLD